MHGFYQPQCTYQGSCKFLCLGLFYYLLNVIIIRTFTLRMKSNQYVSLHCWPLPVCLSHNLPTKHL